MRALQICLSLLIPILLLLGCNQSNSKVEDAPAYHNPLVQPITNQLAKDPDNPELLFQRSRTLMQVGAPKLAQKDLQKAVIKSDSSNPNYLYALSQINLKLNDNEAAIQILNYLLKRTKETQQIRLSLSMAYLQNNQTDLASKTLKQILSADSTYPGALFSQAKVNLAQKDTPAAISLLGKALRLRSDDYSAALLLANCLAAQHNEKAIFQYRMTFALDTTDVAPLVALGEYFEQKGQMEKAKKNYRECLEKDPNCTPALINTGKILMTQDSFAKALRIFNIATMTKPNSSEAYYQKGLCYEKLNQKDSARIAFKQALVFNPKSEEAILGLKRNNTK